MLVLGFCCDRTQSVMVDALQKKAPASMAGV